MSPRFYSIGLVARDIPATLAFYRRLGLTIPESSPERDEHHRSATMDGGIDLDFDSRRFAATWNEGWPDRGQMGVLGFRVAARDVVDEIYGDLVAAGYQGQQPPIDAFWGSRYAVVEDPDGNAVGIMSPPDPARRTPPPPM